MDPKLNYKLQKGEISIIDHSEVTVHTQVISDETPNTDCEIKFENTGKYTAKIKLDGVYASESGV